MARKSKKTRKLKQSVYIVAEGTNTERVYFEAIQPENCSINF